jgi:hypothetical protein
MMVTPFWQENLKRGNCLGLITAPSRPVHHNYTAILTSYGALQQALGD